jgi:hypothetical protein
MNFFKYEALLESLRERMAADGQHEMMGDPCS